MPEPRCRNCGHPRKAEHGLTVHEDDYCYAESWDGDGIVPCECREWADQASASDRRSSDP